MKKDLHPKLYLIDVVDADGNKWKVLSSKNGNLTINSSRTMHTAWTGEQTVIKDNKKADALNKFFKF
jgi:ribosomal protein L31